MKRQGKTVKQKNQAAQILLAQKSNTKPVTVRHKSFVNAKVTMEL